MKRDITKRESPVEQISDILIKRRKKILLFLNNGNPISHILQLKYFGEKNRIDK